METLITLVAGLALGFFIFASLYESPKKRRELTTESISDWRNAKMCENCRCLYSALKHFSCPQCSSSYSQVLLPDLIDTGDEKIESWKKHKRDMRAGKFRTTPKPRKVIPLDSVREEKVSTSDLT